MLLNCTWLFLFKFHFCLEAIGFFHLSMNSVKNLAKKLVNDARKGKISAQPYTSLYTQFLDKENITENDI